MALLRLVLLPLLAVPVVVLSTASPATACDCAPPVEPHVWSDEVYVATVVDDVDDGREVDGYATEVTAVVTHVYRGDDVPTEVEISTWSDLTSCGRSSMEAGREVLVDVSAEEAADGVVPDGACGGPVTTASPEALAEVEAALGSGQARDVPTDALEPRGDRALLWAAALTLLGVGGVGLVALAVGVTRPRRAG
ncbi:hypothetical protein [Nocardioides litoris]|uniref:hypothetical protein n=1 Tax=Nocardioides litoris TaxID=1926648 RepID=UPI001123B4B1|nr:hypothetical protein [Nocardioides litoris]